MNLILPRRELILPPRGLLVPRLSIARRQKSPFPRHPSMTMHQMMLVAGGPPPNPPVFDALGDGGIGDPVDPLTWSHTSSGSNRALIVCVTWLHASATIVGVTYNSVAMTLVENIISANGFRRLSIYKLSNPTSGANTVSVDFSTGVQAAGNSVSFTGAHQTTGSLTGTAAEATGTTSDPTIDVTSASTEICIDCVSCHPLNFTAVCAGQTDRGGAGGGGLLVEISTEPGAGTVTMCWDLITTSDNWCQIGVSVKPP